MCKNFFKMFAKELVPLINHQPQETENTVSCICNISISSVIEINNESGGFTSSINDIFLLFILLKQQLIQVVPIKIL